MCLEINDKKEGFALYNILSDRAIGSTRQKVNRLLKLIIWSRDLMTSGTVQLQGYGVEKSMEKKT